ncbi:MAG: hypothetical protein M1819_003544 [Sarea resinae]|nr:MAG: hypothetical protein M1819_003544 [Sarea resinae]
MSDDKARRIDDALSSLVDATIPSYPGEDEAIADERHDNALDLARNILERDSASGVVSDVNHAADLIKKKLIRDNPAPDKALRFSNLYSRLLTQPVLSQKWAILYLLYQLSDTNDLYNLSGLPPADHQRFYSPNTYGSREGSLAGSRTDRSRSLEPRQARGTGTAFDDAFSSAGLPRLPTLKGKRREKEKDEAQPEKTRPPETERATPAAIKTELLEEKGVVINPPETALLRDLPFTLQGLSSTNLPFASASSLTLPPTLPPPLISLLHTLAEPSLLYRELSEFVQTSEGGLIGQSLRAAVGGELRAYLALVATLETEIRRALATIDENDYRSIGKTGVTLKRCVIWTREATLGLRLMSLMVEESKSKKGGQLISLIHGFSSSHGDPFVGAFAERLLAHVTRPFYDMLRQWIYDGELSDPFLEFFVLEQDPGMGADMHGDPRKAGATSVWEDKYKLDDGMIPSIITSDFAKKVFLIGKSLNFIRYGCGDSAWVESYSKDTSRELRYGDTATLETSIDEAYKTTMARLIHLMDHKFKLFEHLRALKKYMLLGQGDFIALLMESLSSTLDRPGRNQYRHTLTAQLEHAIRGSNAQYDSEDILRRLDARMMELSVGDIGWDLFTLEYKIDAPVDVIVTPFGYRQYLKVFNFLWRIKRVEFALGSTWRRCMTGARGVLASVEDKLGPDWKGARCCIAEMIHFVCQLQYYILFEVIESSWDALQVAVSKAECTLDDLIDAHAKYLDAITHKGLLGSAKSGRSSHHNTTSNSGASATEGFMPQLHEILKTMLAYRDAVDGLYSFSVAEFSRSQELSAKIETRTARGQWGLTDADAADDGNDSAESRPGTSSSNVHKSTHQRLLDTDSPFPISNASNSKNGGGDGKGGAGGGGGSGGDDPTLPSLRSRLRNLSADFKAKLNVLLGDLAYQPDVDMRFLGVVMNFNDVYQPVRRKRRGDKGTDRDRDRDRDKGKEAGREREREKRDRSKEAA